MTYLVVVQENYFLKIREHVRIALVGIPFNIVINRLELVFSRSKILW